MGKFIATYEFEINGGDIPDEGVAELLLATADYRLDYNIWELSPSDPRLIDVKVKV